MTIEPMMEADWPQVRDTLADLRPLVFALAEMVEADAAL